MMRSWIIVLIVLISIGGIMLSLLYMLSPGSYLNAELYTFNCKEEQLIKAIDSFKRINKQYSVPIKYQLRDGRRDSTDYWHHVYFYDASENKIVKTWVRANFDGSSDFAFVSVMYHIDLWDWKKINQDFSWSDNKKQLRQFENRFVVPIRKIAENNK